MKSSNLQPVTHDVFGVLFSEIINESFNYGKTNNIDFNTKSGKALTFGFDKGKDHPASIKALMIKKLDITELDGKELYEYVVEFEKKRPVVIKKKYLQIYVEYIGFNSFTSFLKHQELSDFNRKEQASLFEDFNNTILQSGRYIVPNFYTGVYEGLYLRPENDKSEGNNLLKLSVLICPDGQNTVIVRTKTLGLENYSGNCTRPHKTMLRLNFSYLLDSESYEYSFILDVSKDSTASTFDKTLRGVYSGCDPVTNKPIAGRIILYQRKTWDQLLDQAKSTKPTEFFKAEKEFAPFNFNEEQAFEKLNERIDGNRPYRDFFTIETSYLENTRLLSRINFNKDIFSTLVGDYSVISLRSSGKMLDISPARISKTGRVFINGRTFQDEVRIYEGNAKFIGNNKMTILTERQEDIDDIAFYMLRVDTSQSDEDIAFNGVRIMRAESTEYPPFAGRVLFVKEIDGFYSKDKEMKKVALFPETESDYKILSELENGTYGLLINFIRSYENNIIKVFGEARERSGYKRNIDYGESFIQMAIYYDKKGDTENMKLLLDYAVKQGRNKLEDIFGKFTNLQFEGEICNDKEIFTYKLVDQVFYKIKKLKKKPSV